ncbi:MAG TPA: hypothetical protein DCL48_15260, partial [Alphaproteobacteria bacterium]|nr:hypothetical protein [Alphaproteobacteria bacterium]
MLTILVRGAVVSVCLLLAGGSGAALAQQDQGTQPRLIPVTPEGEAPRRKEMRPVADEPEPPPKPKIIRVRPPKAQPAPANETPAAASAATPAEAVPEIQPAPQVIRVPPARAKRAAPPAETKEEASSQPTDAKEDYEFCNRTSFSVNVALGLRDQAQWRTRGWWTIYPGDCKSIIKGKLMATPHYTFAKTHFIHRGPTRVWGGNHQLCVGRGQFQASTDETGLCGKGLELQGFARIETGGRPSWKTTLVESAA